jgi:excisionase family DNA binding protein
VTARQRNIEAEPPLTPGEVADLFKVPALTVTRRAVHGRIGSVRTLGGHTRYKETEVRRLLQATTQEARPPGRDQR